MIIITTCTSRHSVTQTGTVILRSLQTFPHYWPFQFREELRLLDLGCWMMWDRGGETGSLYTTVLYRLVYSLYTKLVYCQYTESNIVNQSKLMHRPTTLNTFGPIKRSFWTPKLQKVKWGKYFGTPCTCLLYLILQCHFS